MPAWFINSNTGQQQFGNQPDDITADEKNKRQNNRITGNAGYGAMFISTPGGVQRAYNNNVATSNSPYTPYTVGTGRQQERTAYENEQSNKLVGQDQSSINSTVTGIQNRLKNMADRLNKYDTQNEVKSYYGGYTPSITQSNFDTIFGNDADAAVKAFTDAAKLEATNKMNQALGIGTSDDLSSQLLKEKEKYNEMQNYINNIGIPTLDNAGVEDLSNKRRQGLFAAMARARDTGLESELSTAKNLLSNTDSSISDINSLYDTAKGTLSSGIDSYGSSEASSYLDQLAPVKAYNDFLNSLIKGEVNSFNELPSTLYGISDDPRFKLTEEEAISAQDKAKKYNNRSQQFKAWQQEQAKAAAAKLRNYYINGGR